MRLKSLLLSVLFLCVSLTASAEGMKNVNKTADLEIFSMNFDKLVPKVDEFINGNSLMIKKKTQNYDKVSYVLSMDESKYAELKKQLTEWKCAVLSSREETKDISDVLDEYSNKIERLENEIGSMEERMSAEKNDSVRNELDVKFDNMQALLQRKRKEYNDLQASLGTVNLTLDFMRDETTPKQTKVRFVNMPGFEYSFLMVGNPKPGFSAKHYNGYNLKYLFTRGKTFVNVGVGKAMDVAQSDTTTLTDLFSISFGQDFYSRHFGRGSRKCFNMYSGYNLGFMALRGETTSTKTIFVSPTVGVELFKNRFVLWDLRGSYFLPFKHNYDLRGWQVATSFNVAF